jgi:DNA-binding response OmpR family regulator
MERLAKRILVVDDDLDLLMLLERKLMNEGYIVETAASVYEAKEILGVWKPHLILLDININGDDGRKLCGELKMGPSPALSKVLLISGYDYNQGIAVLFGADELIVKPLNVEYLMHRIKHHLSQTAYAVVNRQ